MGYLLPFDRSIRRSQDFGANPGWGPNPPGGHNGDDWATPVGTPVRAAGDGVVVFAGEFDSTYADNWGWNLHYGGLMVILNMDGDTSPYFEYGHNSRLLVKAGDRVIRGQVVALTGNTDGGTGVSTGPHCHVGCLPHNFNLGTSTYGRVNPRLYMTDYPDAGSLAYTGTINYQSTTDKEDFMATMNDQEKDRLLAAVDRILGRDVQRWIGPENQVSDSWVEGWFPARSVDLHDVLALHQLAHDNTAKVLDAVRNIPGVDTAVIDRLGVELEARLDQSVKGLRVTLVPETGGEK